MNNDFNYKNLLISLLICFGLGGLVSLYPLQHMLGNKFSIMVLWYYGHLAGIVPGILLILLRVLKIIRRNDHLYYMVAGVFNVIIALTAVLSLLYYETHSDFLWNRSLLNMTIGFVIFADILLFRSRQPNT